MTSYKLLISALFPDTGEQDGYTHICAIELAIELAQ